MDRFRVALSGDFRKADGAPTFPSFDLNPLKNDSNIEIRWVDAVNGIMPAKGLEGCDALILLAHRMARESFPSDGRLAAVARFGVGYDNVDLAACNEHGVAAIITPDGVRRPVAVSVITFILALSQKLLIKDRLTRQGPPGWAKRVEFMGEGLIDKTLGQLGMGNIGAEVFRMAAPFGMKFIAHDPYIDKAKAAEIGVEVVSSDEVFRRSDFLSVSVPLSDATKHYVNAARLKMMKPTAHLINTARGPIVDQKALYQALKDGTIAGAGLDVFDVEPAPADEPIYKLDNVIVTPHSLCWTDQCFAGIGAADIAAVTEVMHGRVPKGIVNREVTENPRFKQRLVEYARLYSS